MYMEIFIGPGRKFFCHMLSMAKIYHANFLSSVNITCIEDMCIATLIALVKGLSELLV